MFEKNQPGRRRRPTAARKTSAVLPASVVSTLPVMLRPPSLNPTMRDLRQPAQRAALGNPLAPLAGKALRQLGSMQSGAIAFTAMPTSLASEPVKLAAAALVVRAIGERFSIRDQHGPIALAQGPILDDVGEQPVRVGFDARGQLDRLQPCLGSRRFVA